MKRSINGILLLDKPIGLSSNQALQHAKRVYQAQKAGHTGSLDPLATGILPLCFGEAAKFSQYLLDADKTYQVWGRLGYTSSTGDAEGEINAVENAPNISQEDFEKALKAFVGNVNQIPPMYSALKKDGVPLYTLARQGKTVERAIREIKIYSIELNEFAFPDFYITVHCSKGTYIRTLAEDIGKYLNSGAYLLNLRRTKTGPFCIENAYTLDALKELDFDKLQAILLPAETAVEHFSEIILDDTHVKMIQQGKKLESPDFQKYCAHEEKIVRLFQKKNSVENAFIGLGTLSPKGLLSAKRLMASQ